MTIAEYLQQVYEQIERWGYRIYADLSASATGAASSREVFSNSFGVEHDQLLALTLFGLTISVFLLISAVMALKPRKVYKPQQVGRANNVLLFPRYSYPTDSSEVIETPIIRENLSKLSSSRNKV